MSEYVQKINQSIISQTDNASETAAASPKIITIGGGKGGVGKTLFTVLLGLSLVHLKKKTVIVDADFRSPSIHSLLKVNSSRKSLKDFFSQEESDINAVIQQTQFKNLSVISGTTGVLGMTEYCFKNCINLIQSIRKIDADFVLVDLESGTSIEAINLFLTSDEQIIIANPNPMSIQENYSFLKLCQFKNLRDSFKHDSKYISMIKTTYESNNSKNYQNLKKILLEHAAEESDIKLDHLHPKLILNMIRQNDESMEAFAFQMICEDLLGITLDYCGNIPYNTRIRALIKNGQLRKLLSIKVISTIAQKLIHNQPIGATLKKMGLKNRKIDYFNDDDMTCSTRCAIWSDCIYRRGGYPCKLKYMGFLRTSGESV